MAYLAVFRNSLFKYFETVEEGDWEGYLSALDKAGNTVCTKLTKTSSTTASAYSQFDI